MSEKLEAHDWAAKLNDLNADQFTTMIDDEEIVIYQDSSMHSNDVTLTCNIAGFSFIRKGYKIISYDRWEDTHWYDWEEDHA